LRYNRTRGALLCYLLHITGRSFLLLATAILTLWGWRKKAEKKPRGARFMTGPFAFLPGFTSHFINRTSGNGWRVSVRPGRGECEQKKLGPNVPLG